MPEPFFRPAPLPLDVSDVETQTFFEFNALGSAFWHTIFDRLTAMYDGSIPDDQPFALREAEESDPLPSSGSFLLASMVAHLIPLIFSSARAASPSAPFIRVSGALSPRILAWAWALTGA